MVRVQQGRSSDRPFLLGDMMRIVNTVQPRRTFLFHVICPKCPTPLGTWAVAWRVPETTFDEVLLNRQDWLRCVVCLQPMVAIGQSVVLNPQSEHNMVTVLGSEPTPGTIRIVG